MKQIELKVVPITENGREQKLDYQQQMLMALRTPLNPQGANHQETVDVMPVLKKVKEAKSGDMLLLEDEEHATLVKYAKAARYTRIHEAIHDMNEEIANAETVKVEVAKTG